VVVNFKVHLFVSSVMGADAPVIGY